MDGAFILLVDEDNDGLISADLKVPLEPHRFKVAIATGCNDAHALCHVRGIGIRWRAGIVL